MHGDVDPELLLGGREQWPRVDPTAPSGAARAAHGHEDDVAAVSLVLDGPVDWLGFGVWLTMLLHARGREILRVKGLLDVGGEGPLLVDAVQHVVHPPVHLDAWPDDDRRSRLVLIGRGLDAERLEQSLRRSSGGGEGAGVGLSATPGTGSVAARHAEDVLADVGKDEVRGDRCDLVEPGLAELALDVVLLGEAEAAVRVEAGVGRRP